jgi:hypothetical protein
MIVHLQKTIPLFSVLAGDGFAATSNFEGCLSSALSAANSLFNVFVLHK